MLGIAAGLAVVVAIGGGLIAEDALAGGGPQPASVAPGSSFAYVAIDLDPPAQQKYAAARLGRRLGGVAGESGVDGRDLALRPLLHRLLPGLDYERAVRPWRGNRVALAVFRSPAGRPESVVIVRCNDATAARTAVGAAGGGASVAVRDGYALLGTPQAVADAAGSPTPLEQTPGFRRDLARQPRNRVGLAWVDGVSARRVLGSRARWLPDTLVAVARITGRSVEIDASLRGLRVTASGDARALLAALPRSTVAAISATAALPGVGWLERGARSNGLPTTMPDGRTRPGSTLAVGSLPALGERPELGVLLTDRSPQADPRLAVRSGGGQTAVATSPAYAELLLRDGGLGARRGFRAALGRPGRPLVLAAYLDPARLLPLLVTLPSGTSAFDGLGVAAWHEGDGLGLRLRLVTE